MNNILGMIADIFDLNVLALFLIAAFFLLYMDAASFKKQNLEREYKLAKFLGYLYIFVGITGYIVTRFIKV